MAKKRKQAVIPRGEQLDIEGDARTGVSALDPSVRGLQALQNLRQAASMALAANPNLYCPMANTIKKLQKQLDRTVLY